MTKDEGSRRGHKGEILDMQPEKLHLSEDELININQESCCAKGMKMSQRK